MIENYFSKHEGLEVRIKRVCWSKRNACMVEILATVLFQKFISVVSKNSKCNPWGFLVASYLTWHSPVYTTWYPSAMIQRLGQMSWIAAMLHPESTGLNGERCHCCHFPELPVTTWSMPWEAPRCQQPLEESTSADKYCSSRWGCWTFREPDLALLLPHGPSQS